MTFFYMERWRLITKEATDKYCKGEELEEVSVHDDLESLFEDLRLGREVLDDTYHTYFLPELTTKEMELVRRKDTRYLETFNLYLYGNPDVDEAEMKLSESDSKFLYGRGHRRTFTIENKSLISNIQNCSLQ